MSDQQKQQQGQPTKFPPEPSRAKWIFEIVVVFAILHALWIASMGEVLPTDFEGNATMTIASLKDLRLAIEAYKSKTNRFPSNDLRELVTKKFKIPSERVSSQDYYSPNSPNRKIYNKLGEEGGWFYDSKTGEVRVNYNKPLGKDWRRYAEQTPSHW